MLSLGWAAPAALFSAVLALSACGGGMNPTPGGAGLSGVSGAMHAQAEHLTIINVRPNGKKPPVCDLSEFSGGCDSFSQSEGLELDWCVGTVSSPCADTNETSGWSGDVLSSKTQKPAKGINVTWSGPLACSGNPEACGGATTGWYEKDAMVSGTKPPKLATKYVDFQVISACIFSSCGILTSIGLNVVP